MEYILVFLAGTLSSFVAIHFYNLSQKKRMEELLSERFVEGFRNGMLNNINTDNELDAWARHDNGGKRRFRVIATGWKIVGPGEPAERVVVIQDEDIEAEDVLLKCVGVPLLDKWELGVGSRFTIRQSSFDSRLRIIEDTEIFLLPSFES